MQEVWKPIPGYESYYEVSSFGRVRSFDRSTIRTDGKRFNKAGRVLKPNLEQRGYLSVRLCVETVHKIFKVHRLVARAFLQAPHEGQQINHINGIKTDNRPENLEWVNPSENVRHAFDIGLCKTRKGVNNSRCKLSEADVLKVRMLNRQGVSTASISRLMNVSEAAIRNILKGRSWTHVA